MARKSLTSRLRLLSVKVFWPAALCLYFAVPLFIIRVYSRCWTVIVDYLPSPLDIPPVKGKHPETGEDIISKTDDNRAFCCLGFKVQTDNYVGKLVFLRIYSGSLKTGDTVYNATKGKKERIGRLLRMHANHRQDINEAYAGEIVAAVGLKGTATGDTLCTNQQPIILEAITFPEPVISVAIEPKTKEDQDRIGTALHRLAEEDPTFRTYTDHDTGQTLISGMGELHIEVIVDRLFREFHVQANVGKPQVAYKETISSQMQGRREVYQTDWWARTIWPCDSGIGAACHRERL